MTNLRGAACLFGLLLAVSSPAQKLSPRPILPLGHLIAGPSMTTARAGHTATILPDFKVLIAGGGDANGTVLASTEIYDPTQETFSRAANLTVPRQGHIAAVLSDGKILIAGGATAGPHHGTGLSSAEDYDLETGKFSPRGNMHARRVRAAVTTLRDGSPLVTGGTDGDHSLDSAETYSVLTGKWTLVGKMASPRVSHTSTLLQDGRVLIVGGVGKNHEVLANAEIYDPKTKQFTAARSMHHPRYGHTAALLTNGKVVVAGGSDYNQGAALASAEIYDPATNSFAEIGNMATARWRLPAASILLDGRAFVAGGAASAEVLDPIAGTFRTVEGGFDTARFECATVQLMDGSVRIFGGYDDKSGKATAKTWIYRLK